MEYLILIGTAIGVFAWGMFGNMLSNDLYDRSPRFARWVILCASRLMPPVQREHWHEEWLAHLEEMDGKLSMVAHAMGCLRVGIIQKNVRLFKSIPLRWQMLQLEKTLKTSARLLERQHAELNDSRAKIYGPSYHITQSGKNSVGEINYSIYQRTIASHQKLSLLIQIAGQNDLLSDAQTMRLIELLGHTNSLVKAEMEAQRAWHESTWAENTSTILDQE